MSRYRGPRFKKIRRLGALPGLTSKRPRAGSDFRNQLRSVKKSQYRIRLEEKQKLRFHYGLTERQLLKNILASHDRTVIFITHRPAVVDYCDQTLMIEKI